MIKKSLLVLIILLLGIPYCSYAGTITITRLSVFESSSGLEYPVFDKDTCIGLEIECEYTNVNRISFSFEILDPSEKSVFRQSGNSISANKGLGRGGAKTANIPITGFFALPGEYTFCGTADGDSQEKATDRKTFIIQSSSSSFIDLISPGSPFEMGAMPDISTPYPIFQFCAEPQSPSYIFSLYKAMPEQTIAEEIVQNGSVFTQEIFSNQFLYPSFAEPLEDGAIYAWQIEAILPNGNTLKSRISGFYYHQENRQKETGVETFQQVPEIMEVISSQLQGFYPTGNVQLDGETVSVDRIDEVLKAITMGKIRIKEVRVE